MLQEALNVQQSSFTHVVRSPTQSTFVPRLFPSTQANVEHLALEAQQSSLLHAPRHATIGPLLSVGS